MVAAVIAERSQEDPKELFRALLRVLPNAHIEDYYKHGKWQVEAMIIDTVLVEAHRRESGAPEPPPLEEVDLPPMPKASAPRPALLSPQQQRQHGPKAAAPAAAAAVPGGSNELKLISDFITTWGLVATKAKLLLARLNPARRKWVMSNYEGMETLDDFIQHCEEANSWPAPDAAGEAASGALQGARAVKPLLRGILPSGAKSGILPCGAKSGILPSGAKSGSATTTAKAGFAYSGSAAPAKVGVKRPLSPGPVEQNESKVARVAAGAEAVGAAARVPGRPKQPSMGPPQSLLARGSASYSGSAGAYLLSRTAAPKPSGAGWSASRGGPTAKPTAVKPISSPGTAVKAISSPGRATQMPSNHAAVSDYDDSGSLMSETSPVQATPGALIRSLLQRA